MTHSGGIEVKVGFFPLAFFLFACKPRIVIDGAEPEVRNWGTHFFPVSPGRHTVKIYFRYLFKAECGANQREFDVPDVPWIDLTCRSIDGPASCAALC